MRRLCLVCIAPIVLLLSAGLCAAERRGVCGDYSYALPEGYEAFTMPQYDDDRVYVNRRDRHVAKPGRKGVTCITKPNNDGKAFYLEKNTNVYSASAQVKHDRPICFTKYPDFSSDAVQINTIGQVALARDVPSFSSVLVDLSAKNSPVHTILYIWDRDDRFLSKDDPRSALQFELDANDMRRARVMRIVDSVRRMVNNGGRP
jgi:hypothetical protein